MDAVAIHLSIELAPEDCDLEVGELDKTGIMPLGFQLTLRRVSLLGLCRGIPRISGDRFCDPIALAV
jgi:hypothetical protein